MSWVFYFLFFFKVHSGVFVHNRVATLLNADLCCTANGCVYFAINAKSSVGIILLFELYPPLFIYNAELGLNSTKVNVVECLMSMLGVRVFSGSNFTICFGLATVPTSIDDVITREDGEGELYTKPDYNCDGSTIYVLFPNVSSLGLRVAVQVRPKIYQ